MTELLHTLGHSKETGVSAGWLQIPRTSADGTWRRSGVVKGIEQSWVVAKAGTELNISWGKQPLFDEDKHTPATITFKDNKAIIAFANDGVTDDMSEVDFASGDAWNISIFKTKEENKPDRQEVIVVQAKEGTYLVINPARKTFLNDVSEDVLQRDYLRVPEQEWYDQSTGQPLTDTQNRGQGPVIINRLDTGGGAYFARPVVATEDLSAGRVDRHPTNIHGDEVRGAAYDLRGADFSGAIVNAPGTILDHVIQISGKPEQLDRSDTVKIDFANPPTAPQIVAAEDYTAVMGWKQDGMKGMGGEPMLKGPGCEVHLVDMKHQGAGSTAYFIGKDGQMTQLFYEGDQLHSVGESVRLRKNIGGAEITQVKTMIIRKALDGKVLDIRLSPYVSFNINNGQLECVVDD